VKYVDVPVIRGYLPKGGARKKLGVDAQMLAPRVQDAGAELVERRGESIEILGSRRRDEI
jgi:hypothetical protein